MGLVHTLKRWVEAALGVRIYRTGTPLGLDLNNDLKRLAPRFQPRIILDVGANIGQTSLRFNNLWPDAEIYAFEPVSATFEELTRTVEGRRSKIHCVQLALSDEAGRADIHLSNKSTVSTFNPKFAVTTSLSGKTETVSVSTIQDWCSSEGITGIDILKVDAEGHDLRVLRGAVLLFERQKIGAVLVEVHMGSDVEPTLASIRSWLGKYGYVPCAIYDQGSWAAKKVFWGNFLFLPPQNATPIRAGRPIESIGSEP